MYPSEVTPPAVALILGGALVLLYGYWTNRDLFSPGKILLITTALAFAHVAVARYSTGVHVLVALVFLLAWLLMIVEAELPPRLERNSLGLVAPLPVQSVRRAVVVVWLVTLVPISAQLYAIQHFGGWRAYVAMIGLRVIAWAGLGHLRLVINSIAAINMVYFGVLLLGHQPLRARQLLPFGLHVALVIAIGLLSGSRGTTVLPLIGLVVMYNFLRRPVRLAVASAAGLVVLVVVLVLGVARTGYRWTDRGLETGFRNRGSSLWAGAAVFSYGAEPTELAISREPRRLQYGMTYVAAFTNFIPRRMWPTKPPTGGVVMTEDYFNDQWRGASNATPGVFGEGVINFGAPGIIVGSGLLLAVQLGLLALYRRVRLSADGASTRYRLLISGFYALTLPIAVGIVYMEFANAVMAAVTRNVMFLAVGLVVCHVARPADHRSSFHSV